MRARAETRGVPLAILRPSAIYGPYSRFWTDRPVEALLRGPVYLPQEAEGVLHAIFIDDAVDAVLRAASADGRVEGESFIVSGPAPIAWTDFHRGYARLLGVEGPFLLPEQELRRRHAAVRREGRRRALRDPRAMLTLLRDYQPIDRKLQAVARHLPRRMKDRLKTPATGRTGGETAPAAIPDADALARYRSKGDVRIDKAREVLGFEPVTGFEQGLSRTRHYIEQRYIALKDVANRG